MTRSHILLITLLVNFILLYFAYKLIDFDDFSLEKELEIEQIINI